MMLPSYCAQVAVDPTEDWLPIIYLKQIETDLAEPKHLANCVAFYLKRREACDCVLTVCHPADQLACECVLSSAVCPCACNQAQPHQPGQPPNASQLASIVRPFRIVNYADVNELSVTKLTGACFLSRSSLLEPHVFISLLTLSHLLPIPQFLKSASPYMILACPLRHDSLELSSV